MNPGLNSGFTQSVPGDPDNEEIIGLFRRCLEPRS